MKSLMRFSLSSLMILAVVLSGQAWATMDQAKLYKEVFGGEKPKCIVCHVDKLPKKDDGKHDLNEYGKKLEAAKTGEAPDAATYNQAGKAPEVSE
jgi:hypothetical protein